MLCLLRCAAQLRMWFIMMLVLAINEVSLAQMEPVSVVISPVGDLVRLSRQDGVCVNWRCPSKTPTYLVGKRLCAHKIEAVGRCNIQLVPRLANTFSTDSIQSFIAENGSLMVLDSATNQYGVGRLFSLQGTRQRGSNCRVTGLTLLRGNRVLSHQGFSVTSGREITVVVNNDNLAYPKEDYDGEVFSMNISCRDNSQVNCVVFKLKGTIDLTEGKLNEPSQKLTITNYCAVTQAPPTTTNSGRKITSISDVFNDPILRYMIIGTLCVVGLVFCVIITVCTAQCYFCHKHKSTVSTTREQQERSAEETVITLNVKRTPAYEKQLTQKWENSLHHPAHQQDTQGTQTFLRAERREAEEVESKKCTVQANPAYWKHSRAQNHQRANVTDYDSSKVAYLYEDISHI